MLGRLKIFKPKLVALFTAITFSVTVFSPAIVYAQLAPDQLQDLRSGILYFDTQVNSACGATTTSAGGPGSTTGPYAWNSTAQPPYFLEEYVINILEDLAQAKGVPTTDTVTQEHVVALVAWAYAEGGNIANTGSDFNIYNMGYMSNYPQLYKNGGNSDGTQTAFASFNAGVEAYTIELTGSLQSRIGAILAQPSSTAEQVMHAIAYYDETPGNEAWAWGYSPGNPAAVLQFNHTTYITSLLDQLNVARSNYSQEASVVLGPGEENTQHVDPSQLKYSGGTGNSSTASDSGSSSSCTSTSSSPDCTSAKGDATILCEAQKYDPVNYVWGGGHAGGAAYHQACPTIQANDTACGLDCSGLVTVAVYDAFKNSTTWSTTTIVSDTANWKEIDFGQIQAGDLIEPDPGHVEIVDHVVGNTIYTFGAHTDGIPQPDQVGPAQYSNSNGYRYFHYVGVGSS